MVARKAGFAGHPLVAGTPAFPAGFHPATGPGRADAVEVEAQPQRCAIERGLGDGLGFQRTRILSHEDLVLSRPLLDGWHAVLEGLLEVDGRERGLIGIAAHALTDTDESMGGFQAIMVAPDTGVFLAGSDHRKDGQAVGY